MIHIRPAIIEDAKMLLKWKNDKTMRKFSIVTNKKIKMEDHMRWLKKNLKYIHIITDGENAVGDVRIKNREIAVSVDGKYRRMGFGMGAVNYFKKHGMTAKIVDGNLPSLRLFLKCGFMPIDHKFENKIGYYILKYESFTFWI